MTNHHTLLSIVHIIEKEKELPVGRSHLLFAVAVLTLALS